MDAESTGRGLMDSAALAHRAFDLNRTLEETEWTRILGAQGFGATLLEAMRELGELGAPPCQISAAHRVHQSGAEVFRLDVAGIHTQIRLNDEHPLQSTLASAASQVVDAVNQGLRRARATSQFVLMRDACAGHGASYRLVLVPTARLMMPGVLKNPVAGLSPELFEAAIPDPRSAQIFTPPPNLPPTEPRAFS